MEAELFKRESRSGDDMRHIDKFNTIISNHFGQFNKREISRFDLVRNGTDPYNSKDCDGKPYDVVELIEIFPHVDNNYIGNYIVINIVYRILKGGEPDTKLRTVMRFDKSGKLVGANIAFDTTDDLLVLEYLCVSNTAADKLTSFFTELIKFRDDYMDKE